MFFCTILEEQISSRSVTPYIWNYKGVYLMFFLTYVGCKMFQAILWIIRRCCGIQFQVKQVSPGHFYLTNLELSSRSSYFMCAKFIILVDTISVHFFPDNTTWVDVSIIALNIALNSSTKENSSNPFLSRKHSETLGCIQPTPGNHPKYWNSLSCASKKINLSSLMNHALDTTSAVLLFLCNAITDSVYTFCQKTIRNLDEKKGICETDEHGVDIVLVSFLYSLVAQMINAILYLLDNMVISLKDLTVLWTVQASREVYFAEEISLDSMVLNVFSSDSTQPFSVPDDILFVTYLKDFCLCHKPGINVLHRPVSNNEYTSTCRNFLFRLPDASITLNLGMTCLHSSRINALGFFDRVILSFSLEQVHLNFSDLFVRDWVHAWLDLHDSKQLTDSVVRTDSIASMFKRRLLNSMVQLHFKLFLEEITLSYQVWKPLDFAKKNNSTFDLYPYIHLDHPTVRFYMDTAFQPFLSLSITQIICETTLVLHVIEALNRSVMRRDLRLTVLYIMEKCKISFNSLFGSLGSDVLVIEWFPNNFFPEQILYSSQQHDKEESHVCSCLKNKSRQSVEFFAFVEEVEEEKDCEKCRCSTKSFTHQTPKHNGRDSSGFFFCIQKHVSLANEIPSLLSSFPMVATCQLNKPFLKIKSLLSLIEFIRNIQDFMSPYTRGFLLLEYAAQLHHFNLQESCTKEPVLHTADGVVKRSSLNLVVFNFMLHKGSIQIQLSQETALDSINLKSHRDPFDAVCIMAWLNRLSVKMKSKHDVSRQEFFYEIFVSSSQLTVECHYKRPTLCHRGISPSLFATEVFPLVKPMDFRLELNHSQSKEKSYLDRMEIRVSLGRLSIAMLEALPRRLRYLFFSTVNVCPMILLHFDKRLEQKNFRERQPMLLDSVFCHFDEANQKCFEEMGATSQEYFDPSPFVFLTSGFLDYLRRKDFQRKNPAPSTKCAAPLRWNAWQGGFLDCLSTILSFNGRAHPIDLSTTVFIKECRIAFIGGSFHQLWQNKYIERKVPNFSVNFEKIYWDLKSVRFFFVIDENMDICLPLQFGFRLKRAAAIYTPYVHAFDNLLWETTLATPKKSTEGAQKADSNESVLGTCGSMVLFKISEQNSRESSQNGTDFSDSDLSDDSSVLNPDVVGKSVESNKIDVDSINFNDCETTGDRNIGCILYGRMMSSSQSDFKQKITFEINLSLGTLMGNVHSFYLCPLTTFYAKFFDEIHSLFIKVLKKPLSSESYAPNRLQESPCGHDTREEKLRVLLSPKIALKISCLKLRFWTDSNVKRFGRGLEPLSLDCLTLPLPAQDKCSVSSVTARNLLFTVKYIYFVDSDVMSRAFLSWPTLVNTALHGLNSGSVPVSVRFTLESFNFAGYSSSLYNCRTHKGREILLFSLFPYRHNKALFIHASSRGANSDLSCVQCDGKWLQYRLDVDFSHIIVHCDSLHIAELKNVFEEWFLIIPFIRQYRLKRSFSPFSPKQQINAESRSGNIPKDCLIETSSDKPILIAPMNLLMNFSVHSLTFKVFHTSRALLLSFSDSRFALNQTYSLSVCRKEKKWATFPFVLFLNPSARRLPLDMISISLSELLLTVDKGHERQMKKHRHVLFFASRCLIQYDHVISASSSTDSSKNIHCIFEDSSRILHNTMFLQIDFDPFIKVDEPETKQISGIILHLTPVAFAKTCQILCAFVNAFAFLGLQTRRKKRPRGRQGVNIESGQKLSRDFMPKTLQFFLPGLLLYISDEPQEALMNQNLSFCLFMGGISGECQLLSGVTQAWTLSVQEIRSCFNQRKPFYIIPFISLMYSTGVSLSCGPDYHISHFRWEKNYSYTCVIEREQVLNNVFPLFFYSMDKSRKASCSEIVLKSKRFRCWIHKALGHAHRRHSEGIDTSCLFVQYRSKLSLPQLKRLILLRFDCPFIFQVVLFPSWILAAFCWILRFHRLVLKAFDIAKYHFVQSLNRLADQGKCHISQTNDHMVPCVRNINSLTAGVETEDLDASLQMRNSISFTPRDSTQVLNVSSATKFFYLTKHEPLITSLTDLRFSTSVDGGIHLKNFCLWILELDTLAIKSFGYDVKDVLQIPSFCVSGNVRLKRRSDKDEEVKQDWRSFFPVMGWSSLGFSCVRFYLGKINCTALDKSKLVSIRAVSLPTTDMLLTNIFRHAIHCRGSALKNAFHIHWTKPQTGSSLLKLGFREDFRVSSDCFFRDKSMCCLCENPMNLQIHLSSHIVCDEAMDSLRNPCEEGCLTFEFNRLNLQCTGTDFLMAYRLMKMVLNLSKTICFIGNRSQLEKPKSEASQTGVLSGLFPPTRDNSQRWRLKLLIRQIDELRFTFLNSFAIPLIQVKCGHFQIDAQRTVSLCATGHQFSQTVSVFVEQIDIRILVEKKRSNEKYYHKNITDAVCKEKDCTSNIASLLNEIVLCFAPWIENWSFFLKISSTNGDRSTLHISLCLSEAIQLSVTPEHMKSLIMLNSQIANCLTESSTIYRVGVNSVSSLLLFHDKFFISYIKAQQQGIRGDINDSYGEHLQTLKRCWGTAYSRHKISSSENPFAFQAFVEDLRQIGLCYDSEIHCWQTIENETSRSVYYTTKGCNTLWSLNPHSVLLSFMEVNLCDFPVFGRHFKPFSPMLTTPHPFEIIQKSLCIREIFLRIYNALDLPLYVILYLSASSDTADSRETTWSTSIGSKQRVDVQPSFTMLCYGVAIREYKHDSGRWTEPCFLKDLLCSSRRVELVFQNGSRFVAVIRMICREQWEPNGSDSHCFSDFWGFEIQILPFLRISNLLPRAFTCVLLRESNKEIVHLSPFSTKSLARFNSNLHFISCYITENTCSKLEDVKEKVSLTFPTFFLSHTFLHKECDCPSHHFYRHNTKKESGLIRSDPFTPSCFTSEIQELKTCDSQRYSKRLNSHGLLVSWQFNGLCMHLVFSTYVWLLNLTQFKLHYIPLTEKSDSKEPFFFERNSTLFDSFGEVISPLDEEDEQPFIPLPECLSYSFPFLLDSSAEHLTATDFQKNTSHVSTPGIYTSSFTQSPLCTMLSRHQKKNITTDTAQTNPVFYAVPHTAFRVYLNKCCYASEDLPTSQDSLSDNQLNSCKLLQFNDGMTLALQCYTVCIQSVKMFLLAFLPTHVVNNQTPYTLCLRQNLCSNVKPMYQKTVVLQPSSIRQLLWFTILSSRSAFQLSHVSSNAWTSRIPMLPPQGIETSEIESFLLCTPPQGSSEHRNQPPGFHQVVTLASTRKDGVVLITVLIPLTILTREPQPIFISLPLLIRNELCLPLYITTTSPSLYDTYRTRLPANSEIPYWINGYDEERSMRFLLFSMALFHLIHQKESICFLIESTEGSLVEPLQPISLASLLSLSDTPIAFENAHKVAGRFTVNCVNPTTQESCLCHLTWHLVIASRATIPTLSIQGTCALVKPFFKCLCSTVPFTSFSFPKPSSFFSAGNKSFITTFPYALERSPLKEYSLMKNLLPACLLRTSQRFHSSDTPQYNTLTNGILSLLTFYPSKFDFSKISIDIKQIILCFSSHSSQKYSQLPSDSSNSLAPSFNLLVTLTQLNAERLISRMRSDNVKNSRQVLSDHPHLNIISDVIQTTETTSLHDAEECIHFGFSLYSLDLIAKENPFSGSQEDLIPLNNNKLDNLQMLNYGTKVSEGLSGHQLFLFTRNQQEWTTIEEPEILFKLWKLEENNVFFSFSCQIYLPCSENPYENDGHFSIITPKSFGVTQPCSDLGNDLTLENPRHTSSHNFMCLNRMKPTGFAIPFKVERLKMRISPIKLKLNYPLVSRQLRTLPDRFQRLGLHSSSENSNDLRIVLSGVKLMTINSNDVQWNLPVARHNLFPWLFKEVDIYRICFLLTDCKITSLLNIDAMEFSWPERSLRNKQTCINGCKLKLLLQDTLFKKALYQWNHILPSLDLAGHPFKKVRKALERLRSLIGI